ncbi:MAG: alpha-amylase family protein [Clostridiales bacterium]|nr:alpha-amylase family protein [Clostridiales bacterium]
MADKMNVFDNRMKHHEEELRWLYMELYDNSSMYAELCGQMRQYYEERNVGLKELDCRREPDSDLGGCDTLCGGGESNCNHGCKWYVDTNMLGMIIYPEQFAGNLCGIREKLPYVKDCGVNCIHLMPFLDTPKGRSDGGYAVSNFRRVRPDLGTMDDLRALAEDCHSRGISLCMDFVMNHTSEEHEWALRARRGEGEYMSRYFFFDNPDIPQQYEATVPQVFPTTAPGNFTYLPEISHYVMTTFYPYQWDLNYANPRVFNEMIYNLLYMANQGIDIIRLDAVPYIWKELGTNCRNLPKVHTIVRMMRVITEIVCPGVALLGEVVMEPQKVAPYFGTPDKPECHMLYNVTTMATIWNTVATGDTRLLRSQMDALCTLPKEYCFLNYLRCHDDIGWGLDYGFLRKYGIEEVSHKKYLNDYFRGIVPGSVSRGVLYNDDAASGDARFCATTASMCGIEKAGFERDVKAMISAIRKDVMLHAYIFTMSGLPVLYSGDEIGQVNDYSYRKDTEKAYDSRYIHRGIFHWKLAEKRTDKRSVQGKIFQALKKLGAIRRREAIFGADADVYTKDYNDNSVLWIVRDNGHETLHAVFLFGDEGRSIYMPRKREYMNLRTGKVEMIESVWLEGWDFLWMKEVW